MLPNRGMKLYHDLSLPGISLVRNAGLSRKGLTLAEIGVGGATSLPQPLSLPSGSLRALLRLPTPRDRPFDLWDNARERSLCDGHGCPNHAPHRSRLRRFPLDRHRTGADAVGDASAARRSRRHGGEHPSLAGGGRCRRRRVPSPRQDAQGAGHRRPPARRRSRGVGRRQGGRGRGLRRRRLPRSRRRLPGRRPHQVASARGARPHLHDDGQRRE